MPLILGAATNFGSIRGGLSIYAHLTGLPSSASQIPFSYTASIGLAGGMRRPDPISLEETFLLFLLVIPMGYFVVQLLFALIVAL